MFQFGLFSTHLPYIFTILAYLISYGFYAFSKPEQSKSTELSSVSSEKHILVQSGYDLGKHQNASYYAFSDVASDQEVANIQSPTISDRRTYFDSPGHKRFNSVAGSFELYSRPPTRFC